MHSILRQKKDEPYLSEVESEVFNSALVFYLPAEKVYDQKTEKLKTFLINKKQKIYIKQDVNGKIVSFNAEKM